MNSKHSGNFYETRSLNCPDEKHIFLSNELSHETVIEKLDFVRNNLPSSAAKNISNGFVSENLNNLQIFATITQQITTPYF